MATVTTQVQGKENEGRATVEEIIKIACRAGDLVLKMQREGYGRVVGKSNDIDIVTEADLASEALICDALENLTPGVPVWGEESNETPDRADYWIVDPIDGTVNYANHIPYFAVNIALNRGPGVVLAVTLELPAGRIYWAQKGDGTYLRLFGGVESRLHVNKIDTLRRAILSTGFPYKRAETQDNNTAEFDYFMPKCSGVRRMGSCAIDLAMVAAGVFAVHWE